MEKGFFKTINDATQCRAMEADTISKNGASSKSRMSRGKISRSWCTVFVFGLVAFFYTSCGTMKVAENSLDFLKGQPQLHVVISFEDVLLQGKPEKTYLELEQPQWVEGWETAKATVFTDNFMGHLNNNVRMQCGNFPEAPYQATVYVLSVERAGFGSHLEGPGRRDVTCEVVFTKTGDSYPLATLRVSGSSQGNTSSSSNSLSGILGGAGSNTYLTGRAFGYMGQNLGKTIARKTK